MELLDKDKPSVAKIRPHVYDNSFRGNLVTSNRYMKVHYAIQSFVLIFSMVVMLSSFKDGLLRIFIWENERVRTKVLHKQFDNENYGTTTRYDKHINTYLTYHRPYDPSFAVGL